MRGMIANRYGQGLRTALAGLFMASLLGGAVGAMPPHPELLETAAARGESPDELFFSSEARAAGLNAPDDFFVPYLGKQRPGKVVPAPAASAFKILGLLVDFSDQPAVTSAGFFDSLLFDSVGVTVNDYFDEISYGQLDLVTVNLPSSVGWSRAPQTYAYYVNGEKGVGLLSYPNNSQGLVEDLINVVDGQVDFGQYDNDGDGYVDVLLVIHSGTGAELSGSVDDIHSHKWSLKTTLSRDGVYLSSYTVQPEFWYSGGDMTIGVYAHELCHGFGLPDLYDTDESSTGIGDWGIMAYGSWNGPSGLGGSPSHPSAWSRIQMGFATADPVSSNRTAQAMLPVETVGSIYRLPIVDGGEYFLVENRQKTGYDFYLPASGLLIWHIDPAKADNTEEWWPGLPASSHYMVALEQADALYDLEKSTIYTGNTGDGGDPFPGTSSNTSFSVSTAPNSDAYTAGSSLTAVNNISVAGSTITADLVVGAVALVDGEPDDLLPGSVDLSQNYPNPFNPYTTIQFSLEAGAEVDLRIYNALGQKVRTLLNDYVESGTVTLQWDATDDSGRKLASGIYFCELCVGEDKTVRKMALIK